MNKLASPARVHQSTVLNNTHTFFNGRTWKEVKYTHTNFSRRRVCLVLNKKQGQGGNIIATRIIKKKYNLEKHTNQSPSVENCVQSSFFRIIITYKGKEGKIPTESKGFKKISPDSYYLSFSQDQEQQQSGRMSLEKRRKKNCLLLLLDTFSSWRTL